jgi:hypothetical protein
MALAHRLDLGETRAAVCGNHITLVSVTTEANVPIKTATEAGVSSLDGSDGPAIARVNWAVCL